MPSGTLNPIELRQSVPFQARAVSDRLGWLNMEAARYCAAPSSEIRVSPLTHHMIVLITRPPEELELRYEGANRQTLPPAGSIIVVPAGSPALWRWRGLKTSMHVYLAPRLVSQVAAEAFELDPARVSIPPLLDGVHAAQLRAAMMAVDRQLNDNGAGSRLAAESLANIVAVHLIRSARSAPYTAKDPAARVDGPLPQARLRNVAAFVEANLHRGLTLEQMAATAHLSVYHFARQFRAATGLPPHQFVIARRVERARHLLSEGGDDGLSLSEIAFRVGFSDQSQLGHHFRRITGVTPRQFRQAARSP
jgi:AraC family transcriptional regulator